MRSLASLASRASTWCGRLPPRPGYRSCATCAPAASARRRVRWRGAPDILTLARDADYGSHEAFTRAFRDHFGVTPEAVRSSTRLDNLKLQEPIVMDSTALDNLQAPHFETTNPFLVAGLGERYTWESGGPAIPGQWQRFHQSVDNIPGRIGQV